MHSKTKEWFILVIVAAAFCVLPARAAEQETGESDVIRVAIPVPSSTIDQETSSAYVGYTMECLHEISQYTGWDYEVIEVPGSYEEGVQKALAMVRQGEADLVAPIRYNEANQEGIFYSQNSYTTGTTVLQIPNAIYKGKDLGDNLCVAAIAGSGMEDSANQYFAKNGITAQYILCQSIEEQIEMVCSGRADVMLNSNLEYIPNTSIVAEFSPQCLYFAAGDQALLQELDGAVIYIKQANTSFSLDLYKDNLAEGNQELTLEETTFIEQSEPYVVAILDHNAPYQFVDDATGEFQGIAVDTLNYIAQKTGLQFEFMLVESWDAMLSLVKEKKVQIVAEMPYNYTFAADKNLTITRSYTSSPYVLLSQQAFDGPHSGQKLALMEVNTYTDGQYVGDVCRYATMDDCIQAVRSGEADYTYVDLYTAQYYLGDSRYNGMKFTPQSYAPRSLCFGIAEPTPHELLSILNKSLNQLSAADMQNIITQNVNPPRQVTMIDVIVEHPLQSFLIIGVIGISSASLLIFLLWRKEKISRVLRKKAMEDGLTHLYNASACRKLISQKIRQMRPEQIGAFLIMDMDHFKEINDNHGHHMGDRVLQQFAHLLCDTLRGDSIVARIGGDEFVVYLDSIKREENIFSICERILAQAHTICIEDKPLTISIGAVAVQEKDNYDTLYRLADKALYEAKRNQRDQFYLAQREE